MEKKRSSFTGKLGFVLAAAGSAVGLGNLWRFPYLAAQYGGGIFLLVYVVLAVTLGFALMSAEVALGRKTGKSAIQAFSTLDKRFSFVGYLACLVPIIILPYYSVIGGWVSKYLVSYVSGQGHAAAGDAFFGDFISRPFEPLVWFAIFLGVTALVVLFGVEKGIEKVSKILMPILAVLAVGIAIYSVCLPGAFEGVKYYLLPDFKRFNITTVLAAMGQLFYSMSIAMGIMITYGSYMKKSVNLGSSVKQIEFFDTAIAFFAGLMIIPAVFSFSTVNGAVDQATLDATLNKGPGLMFVSLPKVFSSMPSGDFVGVAFFLLVLFAALTSSISLMETIVSFFEDKFHIGRKLSCLIVLVVSLLLGIPSSLGNGMWSNVKILGMDFLSFFDFISNSVLMPVVALLTAIFVGYFIKPAVLVEEAEAEGQKFSGKGLFKVVIKYVAPICIVLILIFSVLEGTGVIKV